MSGVSRGDVPADANQHCPGTASDMAGKSSACEGCPNQSICASAPKGPDPDAIAIQQRLQSVRHIVLVLSGKGGVGKSTVSAQLAFGLAARGLDVGLLDVDICGPSVPKMLGLEGQEVHQSGSGWSPVYVEDNLGVMSIGFLLPNPDDAVIWRGPRKNGLIKQFLKDTDWGALDYLVIDAPPGTSDEHISAAQFLKGCNVLGAVVVTTPQQVAIIDVRKELNFCVKTGLPVLGVVENMSVLHQPVANLQFQDHDGADVTQKVHELLAQHFDVQKLSAVTEVFCSRGGGARAMAKDLGVPFLGALPFDPALGLAGEDGKSVFDAGRVSSSTSSRLASIIDGVVAAAGRVSQPDLNGVNGV